MRDTCFLQEVWRLSARPGGPRQSVGAVLLYQPERVEGKRVGLPIDAEVLVYTVTEAFDGCCSGV